MPDVDFKIIIESKGERIASMDSEQFMKAIGAPRNMFVQTAIENYNSSQSENVARLEVMVKRRQKWKRL